MIESRRLALACCALAGLVSVTTAQAPAPAPAAPASATDLTAIHNRIPSEADRKIITQWIAAQLESAVAKNPPDLAAFRHAFLAEFKANGTDQFHQAFADLSAEAFAKAIADPANAQGPGAMLCGMMLSLLAEMDRPSSLPAALDGLKHKSEYVREQAAACLVRIHDKVPPADVQRAFDAVAAAADKGSNGLALRAMYEALMRYGKPEDATKAVLNALGARIPAYEKRDLRTCPGDTTAADLLADTFTKLRAQITPETQQRAAQRLAELLTVAVLNYKDIAPTDGADAGEPKADRLNLELLIDAAERALVAAAKADPQQLPVTAKMKGPEAGRVEAMQAALDRWIGTPQKPGVLTQAFNVPAGLPNIKLAPATTTRPAAAAKS